MSKALAVSEQLAFQVGRLAVRTDRDGVVDTICLEGELDLANAGDFEDELARVEQTAVA
jgi:hypothetical protein